MGSGKCHYGPTDPKDKIVLSSCNSYSTYMIGLCVREIN